MVASCSEDRSVYIWTQSSGSAPWTPVLMHSFDAPVWRVSWSTTGNVLAVSSGDSDVTLWKQKLDGKTWENITASETPEGGGAVVAQH